ncbi:hypothetical protein N181_09730 [Sinorhizobium fredii USDA 205]|uniref:Uncharacterized protein n=1 Tax=Rhizobium fredii TaxID=380 RepID=A0A2A6LPX6_RHIFR|nr:hypothetical protein N181_09730 [Sinorhizobium fredii USDA 205]PDT44611.1 hypothetical protein CO661_28165 [Sinorhizobium fredii]
MKLQPARKLQWPCPNLMAVAQRDMEFPCQPLVSVRTLPVRCSEIVAEIAPNVREARISTPIRLD